MADNLHLQTSCLRPDGTRDSFLTQELETIERPLWWQEKGLLYTATGYGKRIPTRHLVRYNGKWRRVYCCTFSNAGTWYIGKFEDGLFIS